MINRTPEHAARIKRVTEFLKQHAADMEASNVNVAVILSAIEGLRKQAEDMKPLAEKIEKARRAIEQQDRIL